MIIENRIICAAMQHRETGLVICSVRHFDEIVHGYIKSLKDEGEHFSSAEWEQGFVDRNREFKTRKEAWNIASQAGQIIRRCGGDWIPTENCGRLFSENLY